MDFSYHVVDVFTSVPLQGGNPHAVFPDAAALDTGTMQRIARELNLPETSFVIPEESNEGRIRVRIFTPDAELPFAGGPTIARSADATRFIEVGGHVADLAAGIMSIPAPPR